MRPLKIKYFLLILNLHIIIKQILDILFYSINYFHGLQRKSSGSAEKLGGGVVSGVHVRSITWDNMQENNAVIIETDELEPFQVKAVIAADGVNSEIVS